MGPFAHPGIGSRTRDLRRTAGLTQRQLADAAGLSVTLIRDLEQGVTHAPRLVTVARLAAALGTTADSLAGPDHAPPGRAAGERGDGVRKVVPRVRLRVLGQLAAWHGEIALGLGPHRDRAVLAMLALHPGQLVHREALIAVIWQLLPPPRPLSP